MTDECNYSLYLDKGFQIPALCPNNHMEVCDLRCTSAFNLNELMNDDVPDNIWVCSKDLICAEGLKFFRKTYSKLPYRTLVPEEEDAVEVFNGR